MNCYIGICDDQAGDRDYVQRLAGEWAAARRVSVQIERFSSAESLLFRYAEQKDFDILLLDIEMGAMDGVSLARKIRTGNDTVQIVFITGFPDFMAEGYEVSALHYLLKPVQPEKLFATLDRAVAGMARRSRALLLPVDGETIRLPVDRILYAEAFSHDVAITTEEETLRVRLSISEVERMLGDGFVRCHRSYLAGLRHISKLSKTEVFLDNGTILPMSRSAAPLVTKAFVAYYRGESDETV